MLWRILAAGLLTALLAILPARPQMLGEGVWKTPGGGACSQATAFLGRASGLNAAHTTAYTNLICGLVSDGVWSNLDGLYVFATNSQANALLNLVSSSWNLTITGALTFNADSDMTGSVGANYMSTGYVDNGGAGQFALGNASFSVWISTVADAGNAMGEHFQNFDYQITPDAVAQIFVLFHGNNISFSPAPNAGGLYLGNETSGTTYEIYYNNTLKTSGSVAAGVLNGMTLTWPSDGGTASPLRAGHFGGKLTSGQEGNLYARLNTYITAIHGSVP